MSDEAATGDIILDWNARKYLDYYYGQPAVPTDEAVMFRFLAGGLRTIGTHFSTGLDLGCGPALHHAAQVVPWVDRLDMADYQESNLEEIRRWLRGDPDAFDWSIYIGGARGVLAAEDGRGGSLAEREAMLRAKVSLLRCDLRNDLPLGAPAQYPLVISYYCSEWVIPSLSGWHETMRRITSLVAPGGWLFLAGVHETTYCLMRGPGGPRTPCARITNDDLRTAFATHGFDLSTLQLEVTPGLAPTESGIQGTFMSYLRRG